MRQHMVCHSIRNQTLIFYCFHYKYTKKPEKFTYLDGRQILLKQYIDFHRQQICFITCKIICFETHVTMFLSVNK